MILKFWNGDGQLPYDVLLNETDQDIDGHEMDLFWMYKAKQDPLPTSNNPRALFGTLRYTKPVTSPMLGQEPLTLAPIFAQTAKTSGVETALSPTRYNRRQIKNDSQA